MNKTSYILGPWLKIDVDKEKIIEVEGAENENNLEQANFLLKDVYRPPYVIGDIA